MKAWNGRFSKETHELMDKFNESLSFDIRLYNEDIESSIAHTKMLEKIRIISSDESKKIVFCLNEISNELKNNEVIFLSTDEDIHMLIERLLIEKIGDIGKKLHTARSRNDLVATDMRLFIKKSTLSLQSSLMSLIKVIVELSKKNIEIIMPGYTHLQRAQPILLSYHLMSYAFMLKRDYDKLQDSIKYLDIMPLGAGAFSGTNYETDRNYLCDLLKFESISLNGMDAVSDRDFALDFLYVSSLIMMHLSRLSEEMVIWSSSEFNFINISDSFTTGSSIMPQKKNPDGCELVRGKTGRVYGNLFSLFTVLKGLPMAYNKDMQEDKEGIFDTFDTVKMSLDIYVEILKTSTFNNDSMYKATKSGFLNATDLADYLVSKGESFRNAHFTSGRITAYCIGKSCSIDDLTLAEFKLFSNKIADDIYEFINIETVINNKKSSGSTKLEEVNKSIKYIEEFIIKS